MHKDGASTPDKDAPRVVERLRRARARVQVCDVGALMISGLIDRAVMRIGRSLECVMPPHLAMHVTAQIDRLWVAPELSLLPALVRPTHIAVDAGAADGGYTYWLARLSHHVHAFEPNPVSAAMIRRRVPRAEVHACALSDHIGELELRIPIVNGVPWTGWGTTHPQNRLTSLPPHEVRSIRVECATLDSFGLEKVGFDVLNPAIETVRTWRPAILVEAEERHRPAALQTVARLFSSLHYDGWFLQDGRVQRPSRNSERESTYERGRPSRSTTFSSFPRSWGALRQDRETQEVSLR